MISASNMDTLMPQLVKLASTAGQRIMAIYDSNELEVEFKADKSPLTLADRASHEELLAGLSELQCGPVLSEEGEALSWQQRSSWQQYWLIDPLDGTKEFIKRNGEFTVNIALIQNHQPVAGVVYAPAMDLLYYGSIWTGACKVSAGVTTSIQVDDAPEASGHWRVVGSRSHQSEAFTELMQRFEDYELLSMGSSLKLCLVAEGAADLYPRLGPTCEWDTAAAHAVVAAAGGQVYNWDTREPLAYNRQESLLNPWFLVCAKGAQLRVTTD